MAIVENRSLLETTIAFYDAPSSPGSVNGAVIDTALYAKGVTFFTMGFNLASGEDYKFIIEESDDGTSGFSEVSSSKLTSDISDLYIAADDAAGNLINGVGVVNTKRYLRLTGTSEVGTSGIFQALAVGTKDDQPVENS